MKKFLIIMLVCMQIPAGAETIKISGRNDVNITGGGISSNKIYIKSEIKGHKITVRSPKLTSNKMLKLVNISL